MLSGSWARWSLLLMAAAVLLCGAYFAGHDEGPFDLWVRVVIAVEVVAGILVVLAALAWRDQSPDRFWLVMIVVLGVLCRLVAMPATRELSDDAARYHWDGKVLAHGINPFLHSPESHELAHLPRHPVDDKINHPWNRTCYPPVSQILFAGGYLLSPGSLRGFQLLCLLSELAAWLLLARELARRRLPRAWLLLAVWSPLLIFQGYLPGHVDLLYLPWVVLFFTAVSDGRPGRAGLALAVACLIKPLPLLLAPAAMRRLGLRGSVRLGIIVAVVVLVGYLPLLGAGHRLVESTLLMFREWSFNGSLVRLLEAVLPEGYVRPALGAMFFVLLALATWRGRDLPSRMLLAVLAYVVATPVLFPWYLAVAIPLLVLRPDPALLALVVTIPLTDEVVVRYWTDGTWQPALWPWVAQYVLFYTLLVISVLRRWGMFTRAGST